MQIIGYTLELPKIRVSRLFSCVPGSDVCALSMADEFRCMGCMALSVTLLYDNCKSCLDQAID